MILEGRQSIKLVDPRVSIEFANYIYNSFHLFSYN